MKIVNDYRREPLSGQKPKQIIVLLHGYGSNGQDLISLAPYIQDAVPEALLVSPDAPFPCEMGVGFQWFSIMADGADMDLPIKDTSKYLAGAQQVFPILQEYIDNLLTENGVLDKDLALVGFSQGTMMSLYSGLRRSRQIAGILGYSGALVGEVEVNAQNKPPICLIHGENDSVVQVDAYHNATKVLTEKGYIVTGHSTQGLEHSIDELGITAGKNFLSNIFN